MTIARTTIPIDKPSTLLKTGVSEHILMFYDMSKISFNINDFKAQRTHGYEFRNELMPESVYETLHSDWDIDRERTRPMANMHVTFYENE